MEVDVCIHEFAFLSSCDIFSRREKTALLGALVNIVYNLINGILRCSICYAWLLDLQIAAYEFECCNKILYPILLLLRFISLDHNFATYTG